MSTPPETSTETVRQAAPAVLVIEPARFAANAETRASNRFQRQAPETEALREAARRELEGLAEALENAGVRVLRFAGAEALGLPDEVFPNNWISTHADGTLVTYPMAAPSRRRERRADVVGALAREFRVSRHLDLSDAETRGLYLEGTGSLVLDRRERVAYACRSVRTSPELVARFAAELGFTSELFTAADRDGYAVYHTNVAMSVGTGFAVVAAGSIPDRAERERVVGRLEATGRAVVRLDPDQLHAFAGNLLELEGRAGAVIALSRGALASLDSAQKAVLERCGRLLPADVDTIERIGGGSVRCMLAEIFLPAISRA